MFSKKIIFTFLLFLAMLSVVMVRYEVVKNYYLHRNVVYMLVQNNRSVGNAFSNSQTWRVKPTNESKTMRYGTKNESGSHTIERQPGLHSSNQSSQKLSIGIKTFSQIENKIGKEPGLHSINRSSQNLSVGGTTFQTQPSVLHLTDTTTPEVVQPTVKTRTNDSTGMSMTKSTLELEKTTMSSQKGQVKTKDDNSTKDKNSTTENLKPYGKNSTSENLNPYGKNSTTETLKSYGKNSTTEKLKPIVKNSTTEKNSSEKSTTKKLQGKENKTTLKNPPKKPKKKTGPKTRAKKPDSKETKTKYLDDNNACKIPDLDPFDPSVRKYFSRWKQVCSARKSLTFQRGRWLHIDNEVLNQYYKKKFSHCEYQGINRGDNHDDNFYLYSKSRNFTDKVYIDEDFIRVKCFDKSSRRPLFNNYHAFVARKNKRIKHLKKRLDEHKDKKKPREVLNVVMLGLDSLSRLNHIRHMKKTRDYLIRNMSTIEMRGYNKVADNTFVNLVPILRGKYVEELPWDDSKSKEPFDEYNFIWKNYSSSGYVTSYVEDAPFIAIFNYLKAGFHQPPADHYSRAYGMATYQDTKIWTGFQCIQDRPEMRILLNYTNDFIKVYKDHPHFAFNFLSHVTHDYLSGPCIADEPYYDLFTNLHQNGHLNNTILFFLGDHGFRFGGFRKTFMGRMEERLPMMYLVFPDWFFQKYPEISKNLKINQNRLTTPFDIYETLKDILYFSGKPRGHVDVNKQRGISLFEEIPSERTCESAKILPHWCVCLEHVELSTSNILHKNSAEFLLRTINDFTKDYSDVCSELSLKTVKYVHLVKGNAQEVSASDEDTVQLAIVVTPGDGEFEATMKYNKKMDKFKMAGDISRINKYGHDGDCVENAKLRLYCYCGENDEQNI